MLAPFERTGGESPYAVHRDLQDVMQSLVGIFRTEEDLERALGELQMLKARAARSSAWKARDCLIPGWHLSRDLKSMLTISEAVTKSALARTESRGAHSRIDFPELDADMGAKAQHYCERGRRDGAAGIAHSAMPDDLKAVLAQD